MSYTNRVSEDLIPLAVMYPDDRGPGTHSSAYVNMENYHRAWLVLSVGDMAALSTVDAGLQQGTSAAGAGAKAISGKTITQLTQAGGDEGSLVCIELQTEELDVDNRFSFINFYVTTAVNTVIFGATLYGSCDRFKPGPTTNWAEIVG